MECGFNILFIVSVWLMMMVAMYRIGYKKGWKDTLSKVIGIVGGMESSARNRMNMDSSVTYTVLVVKSMLLERLREAWK